MENKNRVPYEWLALRCQSSEKGAFEDLIAVMERPLPVLRDVFDQQSRQCARRTSGKSGLKRFAVFASCETPELCGRGCTPSH